MAMSPSQQDEYVTLALKLKGTHNVSSIDKLQVSGEISNECGIAWVIRSALIYELHKISQISIS